MGAAGRGRKESLASHRGREAFWAGLEPADCPFPPSSNDAKAWLEGYDAARRFREGLDEQLTSEA